MKNIIENNLPVYLTTGTKLPMGFYGGFDSLTTGIMPTSTGMEWYPKGGGGLVIVTISGVK